MMTTEVLCVGAPGRGGNRFQLITFRFCPVLTPHTRRCLQLDVELLGMVGGQRTEGMDSPSRGGGLYALPCVLDTRNFHVLYFFF